MAMKLMLDIEIKPPKQKINYNDRFFLIGSCFTEHIGKRLEDFKFPVLQNPNGILFDPISVANSLNSYISPRFYQAEDLFFLNELWQSWDHHSHYSATRIDEVLENINASQQRAHQHLLTSTWLIVTLGSSFSYRLQHNNYPVANCHRAPGNYFNKHLLNVDEITDALHRCIANLYEFNPQLKIIFTVSPVRHIRDGVIENNRSKGRLLEAVHQIVGAYDNIYYFPAYELVIDVLRDYRYYDIDLVHPNYAATEFVFDSFQHNYIDSDAFALMDEVKKLMTAYRHKPIHPDTNLHKSFLRNFLEKAIELQSKLPHLDFNNEIKYFSGYK